MGEIELDMSIYMDDISVAGGPEEVKKESRNVQEWKWKRKWNIYSLSKTKYMVVRTGTGMEEDISEQVKT